MPSEGPRQPKKDGKGGGFRSHGLPPVIIQVMNDHDLVHRDVFCYPHFKKVSGENGHHVSMNGILHVFGYLFVGGFL